MDIDFFVTAIRERFSKTNNITDMSEKQLQILITDILLDNGHKVFMEYPYPSNPKEECDIVVTAKNDFNNIENWIEIKSMISPDREYYCNYWNVSKFFNEASFKHDIQKLARASKIAPAWFILFMFIEQDSIDRNVMENPKKRKALTPAQVVQTISCWTSEKPVATELIKEDRLYCHIFLWYVHHFNEIEFQNSQYVIFK